MTTNGANPEAITISMISAGATVHVGPGQYDLVIEGVEGWQRFKEFIDLRFMIGESVPLRIFRPDGTTSVLIQRG